MRRLAYGDVGVVGYEERGGTVGKSQSRIDPVYLNTGPRHHEAQIYLLRLCANLKILHEAKQPLRADPDVLERWSTHRADLEQCMEKTTHFSGYDWSRRGEMRKHGDLITVANSIIGELKLRNIGKGIQKITMRSVDELEHLAARLDDCRKQARFYR